MQSVMANEDTQTKTGDDVTVASSPRSKVGAASLNAILGSYWSGRSTNSPAQDENVVTDAQRREAMAVHGHAA